jgi:glyoxylase-like metal-dependent hydrolase (beta-lactamase superfamily II)
VTATVFPLFMASLTLPASERWPEGRPFPVVAHAIAHDDGVFLFDTGIGTGHPEVDALAGERYVLEEALAAQGIAMADVTAVGNCHLHVDHGGQNWRFSGVPIFVQEREWASVHEPDYTVPEWVDAPGLRYEVLDGPAEVAPGLRLLPTPGHTAGHQSLVVDSPAGTVLITGQAVLTVDEWEGHADAETSGEPLEGEDGREDYRDSVLRLHDLDPARVHFVHDPAIWDRSS